MKLKAGESLDPDKWEWPEPEQLQEQENFDNSLEWIAYSLVGIIFAGFFLIVIGSFWLI